MRLRLMLLFLAPALLLVGAIRPARAQSSWWDKNAGPAVRAEEAAVIARSHPASPPGPPPLFTGAALLLDARGKCIPVNIVRRSECADGVYVVQTRRGDELVSSCALFDPLRSSCEPNRR